MWTSICMVKGAIDCISCISISIFYCHCARCWWKILHELDIIKIDIKRKRFQRWIRNAISRDGRCFRERCVGWMNLFSRASMWSTVKIRPNCSFYVNAWNFRLFQCFPAFTFIHIVLLIFFACSSSRSQNHEWIIFRRKTSGFFEAKFFGRYLKLSSD